MSFVGGKLKLKGGDVPGIKKKKKKDSAAAAGLALAVANAEGGGAEGEAAAAGTSKEASAEELKKVLHGYALAPPSETDDRRTAAEKKHELHNKKLEEERLRKMATKSHRERIKEFNDQLSNLSEHHDIPKVGPG